MPLALCSRLTYVRARRDPKSWSHGRPHACEASSVRPIGQGRTEVYSQSQDDEALDTVASALEAKTEPYVLTLEQEQYPSKRAP